MALFRNKKVVRIGKYRLKIRPKIFFVKKVQNLRNFLRSAKVGKIGESGQNAAKNAAIAESQISGGCDIHTHTSINTYINTYIHMYVCMYVCMYSCIHICMRAIQ